MHQRVCEHQGDLIARGDLDRDMSGSVTGAIDRADTACNVRAWCDQVKPVLNAGEVSLRARYKVAAILRQLHCDVFAHPKFKLGGGHDVGGVWKHGSVVKIIEQAPKVIRVGMCQHDLGDRLAVDTGSLHVVGEPASTWHVMGPGTDVDEDGLAWSSHKRNVAWRRHKITRETDGGFDFGLARIASKKAGGNRQMTIAQHRDREFPMADGFDRRGRRDSLGDSKHRRSDGRCRNPQKLAPTTVLHVHCAYCCQLVARPTHGFRCCLTILSFASSVPRMR